MTIIPYRNGDYEKHVFVSCDACALSVFTEHRRVKMVREICTLSRFSCEKILFSNKVKD